MGALLVDIGMNIGRLQQDVGKVQSEMNKLKGSMDKVADASTRTAKASEKTASSMAGLARGVLRLYAEYYVLSSAVQGVTGALMKGMDVVDKYNMAIVQMAAMMTGMMKTDNKSLATRYREAYGYAAQLNAMIEQVDKNTLLNADDLRSVTAEMMKQGVVVDVNNQKQVDAFTAISNALAVVSVGYPNKEIQLRQEIRALLTGQQRDTDQLSKMLAAQTGDLKGQIALHRQQGDLLEWLATQLQGFAAAQGDINASWEATKTTLQTIATQLLRGAMTNAFQDILSLVKQISEWIAQHKTEIIAVAEQGWAAIKDIAKNIWQILVDTKEVWIGIGKGILIVLSALADVLGFVERIAAGGKNFGVFVVEGLKSIIAQIKKDFPDAAMHAEAALAAFNAKSNSTFDDFGKRTQATAEYLKSGLTPEIKRTMQAMSGGPLFIPSQPYTGKPTFNPPPPDQEAAKKVEQLWHEFNNWKDSVSQLNPQLSETERKMIDIISKADEFIKKGIPYYEVIGAQETARTNLAYDELMKQIEKGEKEMNEMLRGFAEERANTAKEYTQKYTALYVEMSDEIDNEFKKALNAVDREEANRYNVIIQAWLSGAIKSAEEYVKLLDMVRTAAETKTAKINLTEQMRQMTLAQESAQAYATAQNEMLDALSMQSKEQSLQTQLGILNNKLATDQIQLEMLQKQAVIDETAVLQKQKDIQDDILNIERKRVEVIKRTASFAEGINAGLQEWLNDLTTTYDRGKETAKTFADFTHDSIKGAFESIRTGTLDPFVDAFTSFTNKLLNVWEDMIADMIAKNLMQTLSGQITGATAMANIGGTLKTAGPLALLMAAATGSFGGNIQAGGLIGAGLGAGIGGLLGLGVGGTVLGIGSSIAGMTGLTSLAGVGGIGAGGLGALGGMAVGGLVGLAAAAAYALIQSGFSSRTENRGYGIEIAPTSIDAITQGINAQYFTDFMEVSKSFWKVSRDYWTEYSAMDQGTATSLSKLYEGFASGLQNISTAIGGGSIGNYQLPKYRAVLTGLEGNAVTEAIIKSFNEMTEQAMKDLFGGFLDQFKTFEETYTQVATRLVNDQNIVTNALKAMGLTFQGTAKDLIYFTEGMVTLAGDMNTLAGFFNTYASAFLTAGEKQAIVYKELNTGLSALNITLPATREGYAALVRSLNLTTDADQKAFYALMALSGAADQYYTYLEDIAKKTADDAAQALRDLNASIKELIDTAQRAADSALSDAEKILRAAFASEIDRINTAYESSVVILNKQLDDANKALDDITAIVDQLADARKSLRLEDEKYQKGMYQWSMAKLSQLAASGTVPGKGTLDLILPYLTSGDNSKYYSTAVDYQRDYWKTYNSIASLEGVVKTQQAKAQNTVDLLTLQLDTMKTEHEQTLKAMDDQLNAILGLNLPIMSIADAIKNYQTAKDIATNPAGPVITGLYQSIFGRSPDQAGGAYWQQQLMGGMSVPTIMKSMIGSPEWSGMWGGNVVEGLYKSLLGRQSETAGYDYWKSQMQAGMSLSEMIDRFLASEEYIKNIKSVRGYATGGIVSGPTTGYNATLHGTELIVSPRTNYPATVAGGNDDELVAEVKMLRHQMDLLIRNTGKSAKTLDRWDGDGMPAERSVA